MEKITKISNRYKLAVIEDAAQSMGSYYNNKHGGTFGKVSAFSAHPLKNLNIWGDGGFVATNNKKIADKLFHLRNHG